MHTGTLQGLHVLVTRPLQQARQTQQNLMAAGAKVTLFPLLEIVPAEDAGSAQQQLAHTSHYDCVIFISHNAVECAAQLGGESFINGLKYCQVGAIGKKTAQALTRYQITVDFLPESGFTSEDFLALSALQTVNKRSFLIIRGEGGRELLAETLRQRGAQVAYADVYRRVCPVESTADKLKQHHLSQQIDIISLTSSESLHNLLNLMPDNSWLKQIPLLTGSQRMASDARRAGFTADIIVAADPGDQSMQQALTLWRQESMK
ncbi:MAG: uroporphyrinogen-III synthase [Thiolinea sp.]